MNIHKLLLPMLCSAWLAGCSTTAPEVLRIRSLGAPANPASNEVNGAFMGLKRLAKQADNTNVVFVHGIGWTQEAGSREFGEGVLAAFQRGYPGAAIRPGRHGCPTSSREVVKHQDSHDKSLPGLNLWVSPPAPLLSDDPLMSVTVKHIGCLDRTVIELPPPAKKTITVYRLFWDDAMWNSAEWFHMGYDGGALSENGQKMALKGYDDVDALRAQQSAALKKSMVTYGLVDAALYMSPVGKHMREAVQAAICTAVSGAYDAALAKSAAATSADLCGYATQNKAPLLLMSHSLGSRMVFDTMVTDLPPTLATKLAESTTNPSVELHMFANQIPLIGAGRLGDRRSTQRIPGKDVKVVAYSEINDLLTYEVVPYFEQLYYVRCYEPQTAEAGCKRPGPEEWTLRREAFGQDENGRRQLVDKLGFDVVDVRPQFAPNLIPLYSGFKDPSIAHSGHMQNDAVQAMLLCGVENGKPRMALAECRGK